MKVLVAHNETPNKEKWEKFTSVMTEMLCGLEGYGIRKKDVVFGTTRTRISTDSVKNFGLVIAREVVDGVSIGPGTVKKYFEANPDLKLILVVDKEKKSGGKINALYNMGYYDALFSNDFILDSLERLILNGRTQKEAYDYYGLMLYSDYSKAKNDTPPSDNKSDESKVTQRGAEEKASEGTAAKVPEKEEKGKQKSAKRPETDKTSVAEAVKKNEPKDPKGVQKGNGNKGKSSGAKETNTVAKGDMTEEGTSKGGQKVADEATAKKDSKTPKKEKSDNKKTEQNKQNTTKESAKNESDNVVQPSMDETVIAVRENELGNVSYPSDDEDSYIDTSDNEDAELLSEEESSTIDASEFLVPVMAQNHVDAPDLEQEVAEADIKKYIKAIERKAFNPISIDVELSREDEILEEILVYYTEQDTHWLADLESGILSKEHFAQHLWQRIQTLYGDLSDEDQMYIFQRFSSFMWGYDVITPLIEDPTISDIALVAYNNIQVKRYGERYFSTITFRTPNHFKNFINHIIRFNHVDLSDKKPDKTFMDTSTSALARMRFVYSQSYINANGAPSLVIRKVPTKKYTLDELVDLDMMDYRTAAIILEEVRKGHSIIWTGTMASGKTSQMNTYLDFIRHDQRGLVMQENEELFSNTHPLMQFQNIRPSEDGETLYDLRYLATFGLLMDLNYFMIGEIKGAEAEQFVEAVYTNTTCWGSVHSISARDALPRIATLAVTKHFSEEEQLRKLSGGIDMVVYLNKFVVEEIVRVKGWDDKNKCTIYESVDINIPKKKKDKSIKKKNNKVS